MFGEDYAYAVARIRVLETGLLNQAAIEQLLACQDEQSSAFRSLQRRAGETVILQPVRTPFFPGSEKRSGRSWIRW